MKTKLTLLLAIMMLTFSTQLWGQNDTTRTKTRTISHSHSHSNSHNGLDYSYEYNYSYEMPNYPVRCGIRLNTNLSGFSITNTPVAGFAINDALGLQSNMKFGFSFGGFMKVELLKNFALQYELLFSRKVSELEYKSLNTKQDYETWGVEVPVYAIGQLKLGSGKGFVGIGPYVGVGFSSVSKPGNINLYTKDKITDKRTMNRWDVGFGAILGYEFKSGIIANAGYQFGFPNMQSAQKDDFSMTTVTISFGLAYKF